MAGRSILIGFVAAVAVAVSGIAASEAFAEPEIALELRGSVADSGHRYLDQASDVKVFTYNGRIYAVVAATGEGAHLLDITNPASIGTLDNGDVGGRNVVTSSGQMTAIAVYTVGGKPYFIATWAGSNAIQAYKIAEPGDKDGANGDIKQVGRLVNRPNPLIGSSLAGASDLIIYSVGNKQYAAVTVEGADRLAVVEATDPNNLAAANIAGQIIDSGNLELDGPSGVEYYQTNNRHYAVVVSEADDGMQIVDITNPVSPTAAGYLSDDSSTLLDGAEGVAIYSVSGRTYAVVAATIDDGIQIVDITDPANIFPVGKLGDTGSLRLDRVQDVAVHQIGDRHYAVVTSLQEDGIQVVDITNPYNPVPKATIGGPTLNGATGVDTFSIGNRHYAVVASDDGDYVQIVEMTAVNADAGDGLSVDAGRTVVLAGSGSVSSGATPTYQWTQTAGTSVTMSSPTAQRTTFTAPSSPSVLIFQLAATHGGVTSTDIVTVAVAPDAAGSPDKTAVDLALTDSVADSVYTYLRNAVDVKVFEHGGKIYAVVASNSDSIHLLDITDPANINELRHPNPESQSGGNNHNNAVGAESAVPYVAIDGNLYIMLSWGSSDAVQSFYIHSNGRLDELAATVDNIKMDHAADLIIYTLQTRCDSAPGAVLVTGNNSAVKCLGTKIIGMDDDDRVVVEPGDLVARQYAAVIGQLSHSIRIVDVTDPRDLGKPALKGQITDDHSTLLRGPIDIAYYQTNNRHYAVVAASQEDGIQIVDITNPNNPTAAGHLGDTDDLEMKGADGVAVYSVGGRTYAVVTGNSEDGIQIVDITDPHNIFPTGNLADTGMLELENPRGVVVHRIGDRYYAVVAASHDDGIEAVDVTDPYNPVPKGRVGDTTSAELDGATGIDTFSIGNRHYVVVASSDDHGVQIAEMAVLTADAGDDRAVGVDRAVVLDGSASTVSSGDSPTYRWSQTAGPIVTLQSANTAQPLFTAPSSPSTLIFRLTATHGSATATDTVTVSVESDIATPEGEPEIALQLRGVVADSGDVFLNGPYDVKVFTYNGRIYAVVAGSEEGAHLLDITNPASINPLNNGGHSQRNVQPIPSTSQARMQAIAVYTANDGQPYFIATWTVSNAIQAFKIAKAGDTDGAGGAIKQVGTLVNRPAHLSDNRLGGASDLIIYSVGNKHYAAVTAEGADGLVLVDVTDPNALAGKIVGQITDGGSLELDGPSGVEYYQTNNRHYAVVVSSVDDGMQIVDITNPASPTAAGYLSDDSSTLLDGAEGVAIYSVSGRTYAVVAATIDDGIQIVDITDPANIFPAGKLGDAGSLLLDRVHDVAVHQIGDRHYAVVTSINEHGIQVVDVTNPYNPVPKATIRDTTTLNGATGVDTFSIGNRHYAVVAAQDRDYVQIVEMTAVTADAGYGQTVRAGRTVVLDGSASSVSSGASPTYQWTQTGGTSVALSSATAQRTTFTAPPTPSTLIFQLAATHGGVTSTDIVTVSVAPDAAGSPDKTAVDLALTDSVADSVYTYLRNAVDVKVFEHGGKIYAVVASNSDSIHLLDITDPSNINELRHPNPESQSGGNNFNNAPGAESAVPYVAMDGNLYIMLSWGSSDALQSFYIHSNGRLDELAATIDNIKMNHAADLIIYTLQTRCDSTPGAVLVTGLISSFSSQTGVVACKGPKIIGMDDDDRVVVEPGDLVARQYAAVIGQLSHSIRIVDVTDPRDLGKPALKGQITDSTSTLLRGPIDIAYYQTNNRHYAVVAASQEDGIQIVDITNPNNPTAAGHLGDTDDLEMKGADGVAVYSVGGRTYAVVTGNSEDGIQIVDITDPHNIFPTGNLADTGMLELENPRGVVVHRIGDRYYAVVAASHDDGIEAVDVTDPYNPVPKGRVGDTTGAVELDGATGVDTFSIGNRHYVVVASSDDHGVQIAEMAVLTADAGGDRVVPGNTAQIPLDGSASTVSSGDSPTYQWTQTGGPPVTLSTPTIAIPNFAPPAPPQVLSFLLTVSHGNARAVDTVTVTLEGNPSTDVASFGGQIVSETIDVVDVPHNNGTAGTSKYISMHFAGEGESQTFTYRLLEAPSGTVTVSFMTLVQTGHNDAVYTWDWNAVSVSPRTLTFTPSNWYTPQVVTLTSQTDGDNTSEQVIIAIASSAPGSYSGIHVTVDDRPASPGTSGTSGGPVFESAQSPVITLSGPYIMDVQLNSVWTDPGYTATDADGNDITASVTVTGTVDTATAATYLLYYQVADAYGTPATPQTRTVHVIAPEPQQLTQQPQPQPQQTQEPQPEPEPEPEQEPTQEPQQEPEQEPTQEPEQEPEQTQEPEQEPEQTQEPEQEPEGTESGEQPTCDIPAIVRQYDADGSCKIEQGEWLVAVADYAADPPKLTTPQIQQIAAHRG